MRSVTVDDLRQWRRDLHQIPELDFDLPKTIAYITRELESLPGDIRVFSPTKSCVCAFFDRNTPTSLAVRTDMDALPVVEKNSADWASKHPGRMHACGHDGHMAMALALAHEVAAAPERLTRSLLIVFQPAEETTGGANEVAKSGVFDELGVDEIFGFHLWPDLKAGQIASRSGALLAAANEVDVDINGRGAHIARAEQGRDALAAGTHALAAAYDYMAERSKEEPCLLRFGHMEAGTVRNQIAASARLEGSLRTFSVSMRARCMAELPHVMTSAAEPFGCTVDTHFSEGYPPVVNDAALYEKVSHTLPNLCELSEPLLIAEDFAWYQQYLPGVFLLLGTGTGIPLHADTFDFDESILSSGVDTYLRLVGMED